MIDKSSKTIPSDKDVEFLKKQHKVIVMANDLFECSKPMTGVELDILNECMIKNMKSIPTLKNRL